MHALAPVWGIWGPFGAILGRSGGNLEAILGHLGGMLGLFEAKFTIFRRFKAKSVNIVKTYIFLKVFYVFWGPKGSRGDDFRTKLGL